MSPQSHVFLKFNLWQRVEQLYHSALKQEASQRAGFLDQACAEDEDLRREVESLLAYSRAAESFLPSPAHKSENQER